MRIALTADIMLLYRLNLLKPLADGLQKASGNKLYIAVVDKLSPELNEMDVVLAVDKARPDYLLPRVRYISWVQDFVSWPKDHEIAELEPYEANSLPDDIIYTLGDGRSVGIDENDPHWRGSLVEAVELAVFDRPYREPTIDLSFCGFLPTPIETWAKRKYQFLAFVQDTIKEVYRPLRGELDPQSMFDCIKARLLFVAYDKLWAVQTIDEYTQLVKWMIIQYARELERKKIAHLMLSVTDNCKFMGGNWEDYPEFAKWSKPHTFKQEEVLDYYQDSKINLQVNITGFGIHPRVLECMAMRCFVMSHTTPRNCPGQLTECFEPDVHYGVFTPEDFKERAQYWLENPEARMKACEEARKIVRANHLWEHRGAQILKDLSQ